MKIKNGLKKGLSVLGIYATLTLPTANCNKKEVSQQKEEVPIASLEQEVKHVSSPIRILITARSMQSYDHRDAIRAYEEAFSELDWQAEQAGVDFINFVGLYRGDDIIKPGKDWVILENTDNFYFGTINHSTGMINMNSSMLNPKERAVVAKKLLMQHLIGKSNDPKDLTYDRPDITPKKLSENELYKLAEKYGTVKVPKK